MVIADLGFFDWIVKIVSEYYQQILIGLGRTLLLALVGTVVGLIIALIFSSVTQIQINKFDSRIVKILKRIVKIFVKLYVNIFRGTPMLVQAMLFYYGLKALGIGLTPLQAGLLTVTLNTTAYLTEVLRGGIESVDKGQFEGAMSIGMSKTKAYINVIYPQALKNSMASIGNEFIVNIKDSAVLSIIGVMELYNASALAGNRYFKVVESMVVCATIYLILTMTSSFIFKHIEKRIGGPTSEIVSSN